jgi:hypothetical protein
MKYLFSALLLSGCGASNSSSIASLKISDAKTVVTMVASDVQEGKWSSSAKFEKTAQVIEKENPDFVISAGDLSNSRGSVDDYNQLDKAWGRFKTKILPVPGNHDYVAKNAVPFFDYFSNISPRNKGYYVANVGAWMVIGLNWYADSSHKFGKQDAQMVWLADVMKKKPIGMPVLFFSHGPRYTKASGHPEDQNGVSIAWDIMLKYKPDVKIFVGGHLNGIYERWKPMDNNKKYDKNGIRSFLVATGGASPYSAGNTDTLLESTAKVYGAMKLVLRSNGYDWEFKPIEGSTFTDKGSLDF